MTTLDSSELARFSVASSEVAAGAASGLGIELFYYLINICNLSMPHQKTANIIKFADLGIDRLTVFTGIGFVFFYKIYIEFI